MPISSLGAFVTSEGTHSELRRIANDRPAY